MDLWARGIAPQIAHRNTEHGSGNAPTAGFASTAA